MGSLYKVPNLKLLYFRYLTKPLVNETTKGERNKVQCQVYKALTDRCVPAKWC
jgi:hypothetical protein